jgi:hypothetical protein
MPRTLSRGKCTFCQAEYSKAGMTKHLETCKTRATSIESGSTSTISPRSRKMRTKIFHILVEGYRAPQYWIHLDLPSNVTLTDLDNFLRHIWLECCGHLSAFRIDGISYSSDEQMISYSSWNFGPRYKSMDVKLGDILSSGQKFSYEYDFGTTTELSLKVIAEREGGAKENSIHVLARNEPTKTLCQSCGAFAIGVCAKCGDEGGWLCDKCAEIHECGKHMLIPIVNSPRAGVCGYPGIY